MHHPTVVAELQKRADHLQLRIADRITAFAGSMWFVHIHAFLLAVWMLVLEKRRWPTLTLVVSLEATFVMIGQNRQAAFQQAKADSDYASLDKLREENTQLTRDVRLRRNEDTVALPQTGIFASGMPAHAFRYPAADFGHRQTGPVGTGFVSRRQCVEELALRPFSDSPG